MNKSEVITEEKKVPQPEIHLKWDGRAIKVEVVEHRGLALGLVEQAVPAIVKAIQAVRGKERMEAKQASGEYQRGLEKEAKTEGQEMVEHFAEQESQKLPEPSYDKPATQQ